MKAKDILNKYRGQVIKLGFGTGFIYCGKVDDNLEGVLRRADAHLINSANRSKNAAIKRKERAKQEINKIPGTIEKQRKMVAMCEAEVEKLKAELDREKVKDVQDFLRSRIREFKDRIAGLTGDKKHEGEININKRRLTYVKALIPKLDRSIKTIEKYIKEYKPLAEREVTKEYHSIDYSDLYPIDMIVICEGNEDGKYWTIKEYEEDTERPY